MVFDLETFISLLIATVLVLALYVLLSDILRDFIGRARAKRAEAARAERRRLAKEIIRDHYGSLPSRLVVSATLDSSVVLFSWPGEEGGFFHMNNDGELISDECRFPAII